jgi:hypothetical protein
MTRRRTIISVIQLALFVALATAGRAAAEEGFSPLANTGATVEGGGGTTTLSTGSLTITCKAMEPTLVVFSNHKHATGHLKFTGCQTVGLAVFSLGDPKETFLVEALFLVCLNAGESKFGIAIEFDQTLHLEIPSVGVLFVVRGLVIGRVLTVFSSAVYSIDFGGSKGKQAVTECKEGLNTKKHTLSLEMNENGKPETASENIVPVLLSFSEPEELVDS